MADKKKTVFDVVCDIQKALEPLGFEITSFDGSMSDLNIVLQHPARRLSYSFMSKEERHHSPMM
jgi:hypothetical protein